tara:strand:+ start:165 stop:350 length:186 start_codon:yes stop_codon:yes gene_type:complete
MKMSEVPELKRGDLLEMDISGHLDIFIKRQGRRCDLIWVHSAAEGKLVIVDPRYYKRVSSV